MSIYKIIKGNTFLSTTEEGRDDKNDDCGARKKGGVFFFHLVGGTVEGVRCCVSGARAYRENGSLRYNANKKKNGGASVLVERVSGKTV